MVTFTILYFIYFMKMKTENKLFESVYSVVRKIPTGKVATYGQIAALINPCTPRQVGYAMAATPPNSGIPWHRVINSQGKISIRSSGGESMEQKALLEYEGVIFDSSGKVDLNQFLWDPFNDQD
jgi:methylated-DNA-protein-cysteine methyltransferase-like protein